MLLTRVVDCIFMYQSTLDTISSTQKSSVTKIPHNKLTYHKLFVLQLDRNIPTTTLLCIGKYKSKSLSFTVYALE